MLEGVDALGRGAAVGGATVDGDLQPNHAIVPAADAGALAALKHQSEIGTDPPVLDQPSGAKGGIGFLVGGEGDFHVIGEHGPGGTHSAQSE